MHTAKRSTVHTLGPEGTNCAMAAQWWLDAYQQHLPVSGGIVLHETLEQAFEALAEQQEGYLLSCAAYPDLHTLIFNRLDQMELCDSFIMPTHSMVLATRVPLDKVRSVATHPAPQSLVGGQYNKVFANSNADAAVLCRRGTADACVTTVVAADRHDLQIVEDFGQVPMAFLLHTLKRAPYANC